MKALRFNQFGPPSVLRLEDLPMPQASKTEAVVKVAAAGINPSDVKNVEGKMPQTTLPRVPGRDFAGVVVNGPPEWRGAEVWGTGGELGFTRDGTHADAVLVPLCSLQRKPAGLSFAQAAAVGTPFVTAYLGLGRASVAQGEWALVIGAAGAVGSAAVQIARWRGARVAGLVLTEAQARVARESGVERVVQVPPGADASEALRSQLREKVQVAFDTSGASLDACIGVLERGGRVVAITAPPDGMATFNLRNLYHQEGQILGVDSLKLSSVDGGAVLAELALGFQTGALRPPAVTEVPLTDAVAAYSRRGAKLVLVSV